MITVTLGSTSLSAGFFQLNIASVVNPPSTTETDSFLFETQDASGTVLDTQTSSITLQATAGSLTSVTLSPSSDVVGANNTLTVTIVLAHAVIAGGKVKLTLPKWNPNATVSSEILSMVRTGFSVTAITNLQQSTLTSTLVTGSSSDTLTISNAIPTEVSATSTISFSVDNFYNPISTATYSGFTVETTDSSDGSIDSGSSTLRVTTSAAVYNTTLQANDTTIVQELAVFRVQFFVPVPLDSGCIIDVTYPSDFTLSGSNLTTVQGIGLFGGSRTLTGSVNSGNNTYTITDGCNSYVSQDQLGILDFTSIHNPFTVKTTGSLSIYVKDSSQFDIAQITTGVTYTATTGTLNNVTLTPETTTVATSTSITITFLPVHELTADNVQITITLPSDVTITDQTDASTCSLSDIQNMSPTTNCTVISNVITLIDPFDVFYTPTSTEILAFTIAGMTMPPSLKPPGDVVITTSIQNSSVYYNVDTVSASNLFLSTVGSLTDATATPSNTLAYSSATYTFSFKPQNNVLTGGFVTILIPSEISINDTTTSAASCASVSGYDAGLSCSISSSTITVSNGFPSANFTAGNTLSFSMTGVTNPVSTATSSSFTYTTLDSSNFQIDTRSSGITVTMLTTNEFSSITLASNSTTNSETATYTFNFIASSPLVDGDQIFMQIPSSITPPTTTTCSGVTELSSSLACTILNTQIYITLSFGTSTSLDPNSAFSLSVSNFTNPSSTKPSDGFTFEAQDSNNFTINTYTSAVTVTFNTDTPSTITTASVANDNQDASQNATFTLTFTTVNEIPVNGSIIITYPSEVSLADSSVTAVTCSVNVATSPNCTHDSVNRQITITNVVTASSLVTGTNVTIELNEMKNQENATATGSFSIETFEVDSSVNYAIDRVNSGLTLTVN